jgi:CRISPR/Cas system CSM-associated protein Csm3 (group 7 of RAMP superfamily)
VSPAAAIVETLIRPTSPLLVSPERGGARGEKLDLIFRREGEQVRIPASSLKGMLRAQCRRILLTKLESRFPDTEDKLRVRVADDMIGNIFGSTDAAALLYLDDARGPYAEKDVHRQFFNAVDRFTGGAAKHRLYNVRAVFPKELAWKLNLQPPLLEPDAAWALALLCYVLRDAMEGDLSIGWGRARGYGSFRLALDLAAGKVLSDWSEVLRELDEGGLDFASGTAEGWLDALEKELAERMQVAAQAAEGGGQQ